MIMRSKCDHDKNDLKFYSRNMVNKKPPLPIELAVINLKYWAKGGTNFLQALKTVRISDRRIRSERRESIAQVAACLIDHTDLCTMRPIKITGDNVKSSLNVGLISAITRLHKKRVLRAIDDLNRGGYLKIRREIRRPRNGEWRRNLHIDEVSGRLFKALGVPFKMFKRTIDHIKQKSAEITKKTVNQAGIQRIANLVSNAFSKTRESTIELTKQKPKASPTKSISSFLQKYAQRCTT